jgi:hypothetical protein
MPLFTSEPIADDGVILLLNGFDTLYYGRDSKPVYRKYVLLLILKILNDFNIEHQVTLAPSVGLRWCSVEEHGDGMKYLLNLIHSHYLTYNQSKRNKLLYCLFQAANQQRSSSDNSINPHTLRVLAPTVVPPSPPLVGIELNPVSDAYYTLCMSYHIIPSVVWF